jgi:hypothetical protein
MKKTIISLLTILIAIPSIAIADGELKFEWAPQMDMDVVGYMIFCREEGDEYDYNNPVWEGDETFSQCIIGGLDKSKTYYFVIRSVDRDDNQSYDSPEIQFTHGGTDAGLGGDDVGSGDDGGGSSTSFSSCFLQTLSE